MLDNAKDTLPQNFQIVESKEETTIRVEKTAKPSCTAPVCTDSTKNTPMQENIGFKRSGVA